jgi:hypothetical protein
MQWTGEAGSARWVVPRRIETLRPEGRSHAVLFHLQLAILSEPALKSSEINVETFKGAVQLSGSVKSQADVNKAIEVARDLGGVTTVENEMRFR